MSFVTEPAAAGGNGKVGRATGVRAADGDVDLTSLLVRGDPVEERRSAVGVLRRVGDAVGQGRRHRGGRARGFAWREDEEPDVPRQVLVVDRVLPVAVEHEHAFALAEAGVRVGVFDRVGVLREVAGLDPLLEVLGGSQVGRGIDRRAWLLEDPVVDRLGRAIGGHEVLQRECEPASAGRGVPLHDRLEVGGLGLGKKVLELGHGLRRLGHADLLCELLVVEHACQAVVQAHGIERTRTASPVGSDPILRELRGGKLVPAERCRVAVEVLEQPILDERDHRGEPDEIRRIVTGQESRCRGHQVRELVLRDLPGHVRELLGEFLRELEREIESRLEVGVEDHRVRSTRWPCRDRARGRCLAGRTDRWGGRCGRGGSTRRWRRCCAWGRAGGEHHDCDRERGDTSSRKRRIGALDRVADHEHSSSIGLPCGFATPSSRRHPRPSFGRAVVSRTTSSGARWTTGASSDRSSICARRTSAPRRPDSSSCWRMVVSPT